MRVARDGPGRPLDDVAHLTLAFGDGSMAAIHYPVTGASRFQKERVVAVLRRRDYVDRQLVAAAHVGVGRVNRPFGRRLDKGHEAKLVAFAAPCAAIRPPFLRGTLRGLALLRAGR